MNKLGFCPQELHSQPCRLPGPSIDRSDRKSPRSNLACLRNEEALSKEVTFELDLSRSRSRPSGEIGKSKRKDEDAGAGRSRDKTKVPEPFRSGTRGGSRPLASLCFTSSARLQMEPTLKLHH